MKELQDGENYSDYINRRIDEIFNDLAEQAGNRIVKEYGKDAPAGALAFELMSKSIQLQNAWKEIVS